MADTFILTPAAGGRAIGAPDGMTLAEVDRFFDNRNPRDWQVTSVIPAGGCAPPILAPFTRMQTRHISPYHAIQEPLPAADA